MQYFCSDIDMIRIFTRRKRLLTIILLTMFIALGARAQDDEDIAHSLNLTEVVVLADGMTFEEYLLKQVLAHAKPLKEGAHEVAEIHGDLPGGEGYGLE